MKTRQAQKRFQKKKKQTKRSSSTGIAQRYNELLRLRSAIEAMQNNQERT